MAAYSEAHGDFCPAPNAPTASKARGGAASRGSTGPGRLGSNIDRVDDAATQAMQGDGSEHAATSFGSLCAARD